MENSQLLAMLSLLSKNNGNQKPEKKDPVVEQTNIMLKQMESLRGDFVKGVRLLRNRIDELENMNNNFQTVIDNQDIVIKNIVDKKMKQYTIETVDAYTAKSRLKEGTTITSDSSDSIGDAKGVGMVNQLLCIATTNNFHIYIKIDNEILWDKPYTYFYDNSEYLEDISGFIKAGKYYLSIRNISFQKNFVVTISSLGTTVFDQILLKYKVRGEIPV